MLCIRGDAQWSPDERPLNKVAGRRGCRETKCEVGFGNVTCKNFSLCFIEALN